MAFHSRKEFAVLTGVSTGNVATYLERRKLLLSGKLIDDTIEPNASFLKKRLEYIASNPKPAAKKEGDTTPAAPPVEKPKADKKAPPVKEPKHNPLYETDRKIKEIELRQKESNLRIGLLREEKLRGESIPVNLVNDLFSQLGNAIISSYRDGAENLLQEICFTNRIPDNELARLRGKLVEIINKSHKNAIDATKKSVKRLKEEYAQSKEPADPELKF